jgi:Putative zinc ribbon domain
MSYKNCQSCGMPLSKDKKGGGTEADGTHSLMYCSHCYQDGKFTLPDFTVDQMIEQVKGRMKEMHIPGFLGYFFTRNIPKLRRWAG